MVAVEYKFVSFDTKDILMKWSLPDSHAFVFLSFLASASICLTGRAQDPSKEMAAKLAEICRKHDVPAMTIAVVNAKGLVQSQCFGNRERGTTDQLDRWKCVRQIFVR